MEPPSSGYANLEEIQKEISGDILELLKLDYQPGASTQADIKIYGKLSGRILQHIERIGGADNFTGTDRVVLSKILRVLKVEICSFLESDRRENLDKFEEGHENRFIVRIKKELRKDDIEILSNTLYTAAFKSTKLISALQPRSSQSQGLQAPLSKPAEPLHSPKPIGKKRNENRKLPDRPSPKQGITKK